MSSGIIILYLCEQAILLYPAQKTFKR